MREKKMQGKRDGRFLTTCAGIFIIIAVMVITPAGGMDLSIYTGDPTLPVWVYDDTGGYVIPGEISGWDDIYMSPEPVTPPDTSGSSSGAGTTYYYPEEPVIAVPDDSAGTTGQFAPPPPLTGEQLVYKFHGVPPPSQYRRWGQKPVSTPVPELPVVEQPPLQPLNVTSPAGGFGSGEDQGGYGGGGDGDSPALDAAFRKPEFGLTPGTNTTPGGPNATRPTPVSTPPVPSDTPPEQIPGGDRIPPGSSLEERLNDIRDQGAILSGPGKTDTAVRGTDPQKNEVSSILSGFRDVAVGTALPAAATIIPPQRAGLLAIAITVALSALGGLFETRSPRRWKKTVDYSRNFLGNYGIGIFGTNESKLRKATVNSGKPVFIGLSAMEILVIIAGAVLYGLAFLVAQKEWLSLSMFLMFTVTAGVAITIHEVGHRYVAKKYRDEVELKLWDIGILTMFVTAILTGIVFAKPSKNVITSAAAIPKDQMGRIMLAGPVISVLAGLVFVPFLFIGGMYQTAASMSIMFNLIIGTYHLMPFTPMDGRAILRWSGILWFVIFVPLIIAYFFLFMG